MRFAPTLSAARRMTNIIQFGRKIDRLILTDMLLEEFVQSGKCVPEEAVAVQTLDELPRSLRQCAEQMRPSARWRAWTHHYRTWFVIGELVDGIRAAQEHVMRIMFHDMNGTVVACAEWIRRSSSRWVLYRVLDPSICNDASGRDVWHEREAV